MADPDSGLVDRFNGFRMVEGISRSRAKSVQRGKKATVENEEESMYQLPDDETISNMSMRVVLGETNRIF